MTTLTGRCLCEAVHYEITGELGTVYNCHCSKCRRWHGAAFRTRASIRRDQLTWLSGEDNLSAYASSGNITKYFCRTCGSPLHSTYADQPEVLGMPLGPLEGLPETTPRAHIFTASKATWYRITDDIPRYDEWLGEGTQHR